MRDAGAENMPALKVSVVKRLASETLLYRTVSAPRGQLSWLSLAIWDSEICALVGRSKVTRHTQVGSAQSS
jgi:hypothetical protein